MVVRPVDKFCSYCKCKLPDLVSAEEVLTAGGVTLRAQYEGDVPIAVFVGEQRVWIPLQPEPAGALLRREFEEALGVPGAVFPLRHRGGTLE